MWPFKIFERNRFCFCFYKQNWGTNTCTLCTPAVSQTALQLGLCECVADTKSLPISNMSKTAAAAATAAAARRVVAGDFDPTHYFSFTFRHCGGGVRRRRRWRGVRQRCTLAKNHHLAKLSRLRHCQMRKEIDLPSGPWHRQPLRYT